MKRVFFTLWQGWKYRQRLRRVSSIDSVTSICLSELDKRGVKVLVLDFDGVLAPHGAFAPLPQVEGFLRQACAHYSPHHVYLLSNKPMQKRIQYFAEHFPFIRVIIAKKKPYPDGLNTIIQQTGEKSEALALVDDRLLTGGLATVLANTQFLYVKNPFVDYAARPIIELFFQSLRYLERCL